jgi:hypothetical protein
MAVLFLSVVFFVAKRGGHQMMRGNRNLAGAWPGARTLLACLLALVAGGCGTGAAPEQTAAIAELQRIGARVNFKRGGYEVDFTNTGVTDRDLANLPKISNLKTVDLRGTFVTDAGLEHLRGLESLEVLELARTRVSDEGFEDLKKALPNASLRH